MIATKTPSEIQLGVQFMKQCRTGQPSFLTTNGRPAGFARMAAYLVIVITGVGVVILNLNTHEDGANYFVKD